MMKNYVIIGGGIASLGCIDGIRKHDKDGKITLISGEEYLPYARPLISYYLENKTTLEKMNYRSEDFYKKNNVEVKRGVKADKINRNTVSCDDGTEVSFDRLLAAMGSSPFVPPISGAENVKKQFTFMTICDTLKVESSINKKSRVLIVGAGLIGVKCAEGLADRVKEITVCDLAPKVLSSILDDECAALVKEKLERRGINLMLADTVEKFEDANTAKMKSGKTVEFDVLVMAVGVRPNLGLLKDIGAEINRGVVINNKMETSLPGIYAAGDLTEGYDISSESNKVMAILPNAYMQGFCAGENMSGAEAEFDNQIPMNSIGFFGYHMMTAGSYDGELYEEKSADNIKKLYVKDNRLVGLIFLGNVDKVGIYTSLIRNKTPLDTIDFDRLKISPSLLAFSKGYRSKNLGGVSQ